MNSERFLSIQWVLQRVFVGVSAFAHLVHAEGVDSEDARLRIEATRLQGMEAFDRLEYACQQRFAVTDCARDVDAKRHAFLADLKRQESVLNEARRKQQGAEQLQSIQSKQEARFAQALETSESDTVPQEQRLQAQADKRKAHQEQAHPSESKQPKVSAGPSVNERQANRAAYAQKLLDAQKRQTDRAKREHASAQSAAHLPVQP